MGRGRKKIEETPELSDRQKIIKDIRSVPKADRTQEQVATLTTLVREEARDRFVRLANRRTLNALKALDNVGRMGNKTVYEYTDAEAAEICDALASKLAAVRGAFQGRGEKAAFDLFDK